MDVDISGIPKQDGDVDKLTNGRNVTWKWCETDVVKNIEVKLQVIFQGMFLFGMFFTSKVAWIWIFYWFLAGPTEVD